MKILRIVIIAFSVGLLSCKNQLLLGKEDSRIWKDDLLGCNNKRLEVFERFRIYQQEFIGKSKKQVLHSFGAPDSIFTDEYGEDFYYFMEPGSQCDGLYENNKSEGWEIQGIIYSFENEIVMNYIVAKP